MFNDIPATALEVIRTLQESGYKAYLVGGCVRDMIRGSIPHDWDIATCCQPELVQGMFPITIPTGIEHGTVTVCVKTAEGLDQYEVTTFRSEGKYTDGRRPDCVHYETDVHADLSRRDFTINAMAYDPISKELVDPFGGQEDLDRGLVRCVGNPNSRFQEDGLRCLRAIRFACRFEFILDEDTYKAIEPNLATFGNVAMERVTDEFLKILKTRTADRGLYMLRNTGLLDLFLPQVVEPSFQVVNRALQDVEVRLAILVKMATFLDVRVLEKLVLPTKTLDRIDVLIDNPLPACSVTDRKVRTWLRDIGPSDHSISQALSMGYAMKPDECRAMVQRVDFLRNDPLYPKQLALNGKEIMDVLNVKPGPVVGQATKFLMDLVLDDPKQNTSDRLRAALAMLP